MDQTFQKLKSNVTQDKAQVFKHCNRIVRCIIDCQQSLGDSVIVLNALQLSRCLEGKAWENSAIELRQIEGIGPASIKKLVNANVKSLQKLAEKGSTEIERILSRNPPFGTKILKSVNSVPQFQLSAIQVGKPSVCNPKNLVIYRDSLQSNRKTARQNYRKLKFRQLLKSLIRKPFRVGLKAWS